MLLSALCQHAPRGVWIETEREVNQRRINNHGLPEMLKRC